MCAEFERVERVVQNDVWPEEKDQNHSAYSSSSAPPNESRMVKKFRRAAAGLEEQLPSDLRPPSVLKRTCDYLFHDVVGNAALEKVHHFVWDRTRAIRNDFSIQQLTKPEDLRLAIDCYERIARFHILSIHQLAVLPRPYDKYDAQQEREQLDRTLLSLVQYYDDCRGRLDLPNEAEFRAYCVIFQLQDPIPDLEDRVQSWPKQVLRDKRVPIALDLYAAACNTMDTQGPLKPRASHLIAQQDWQRFWLMVESPQVSYLMACVAEIYFNLVRRTALNALWRSFKSNPNRSPEDWTVEALLEVLVFDDEQQVHTFCEAYGFSFAQKAEGLEFLDLTSVKERNLPSPNVGLPKQWKSGLVEGKRFGRTMPAIINGLTVKLARATGQLVGDEEEGVPNSVPGPDLMSEREPPTEDESSLFIPEIKKQSLDGGDVKDFDKVQRQQSSSIGHHGTFSFGKASGSTFGKPLGGVKSEDKEAFAPKKAPDSGNIQPVFNFTQTPGNVQSTSPAVLTNTQVQAAPLALSVDAKAHLPTFEPPRFKGAGTFGFALNSETSGRHVQEQKNPFFNFSSVENGSQAANPASNETSPTQGFPWDKQRAQQSADNEEPVITDHFSNEHKSIFKSAPSSSHQAPNVTQAQNEVGGTSSQAHVTNVEVKLSQPQQMVSPPGPAPSTNSNASATLPRKASVQKETKPKTPSPLSNSFSFEDVSNPPTFSASNGKTPALNGPVQNKESTNDETQTPFGNIRLSSNIDQEVSFESVISRIAHEITLEHGRGFLDQYIEFTIQEAIATAKEQFDDERETHRADSYRKLVLSRRYFHRWKDIFWGKRFAKRATFRRERARQGLEEYKRCQILKKSLPGLKSAALSPMRPDMLDNTSQRTSPSGQPPSGVTQVERHAQAGNKRTRSSHGADVIGEPCDAHPKRHKSTSHIDVHGRVTKPTLVNNTTADLLKRSSFLGFSLPHCARGNGSTTRSNYFRLKAMGIEPHTLDRSTKHRRDGSADVPEALSRASTPISATASCLRTSRGSTAEGSLPPPTRSGTPSADDEALFARLKTARENLLESTDYMRAEIAREEEFKRNFRASQASNESPSMARARAEARLCASTSGTLFAATEQTNDVPAYRLRESKFVPREHYGRAIDRANEIRASRSRNTSRPESRTEGQAALSPQHQSTFLSSQDVLGLQSQQEYPILVRSSNRIPASHLLKTQGTEATSHELQSSGFPNGQRAPFSSQQGIQSWASLNFDPLANSIFASSFDKANISSPTGEPHDFTMQHNELEQTLSQIGSSHQGYSHQTEQSYQQHSVIPSQPDCYIHTEQSGLVELTPDDEEMESQPAYYNKSVQMPDRLGDVAGARNKDSLYQSVSGQESQAFYDSDNEFIASGIETVEGGTGDDVGDSDVEADDDEVHSDIQGRAEVQGSKRYDYDDEDGYADEEDVDSDEEGEDERLYDEDDEEIDPRDLGRSPARDMVYSSNDYSEESYEEDEEDGPPNAQVWGQPAPMKESQASVGGTAEEAIELSD